MRAGFETIALSRVDGHILTVKLDRPEVSNALNTRMGFDFVEVFNNLPIDRPSNPVPRPCKPAAGTRPILGAIAGDAWEACRLHRAQRLFQTAVTV